jgi:uncharacterized phage protein (TIGR02220 family)
VDWANERYVRVYTRDTTDLLAVGWEGRAVLWELMRKCDRAGVIDFDGDTAVLAEMLRMPEEIVSLALPKLERRGVVERGDGTLVVPNFLEAQEASQSDKQRARESRARRRDRARHEQSQDVTPASQNVTTTSHAVTAGHAESHAVTPCRAVPCRATPSLEDIVPAYAGTHPPERVEGGVPVAGALSAPESPALRAEPYHDHETPAQGKPDPLDAKPAGFALTPPLTHAERDHARARAVCRDVVAHLNTRTGRQGAERFDLIAKGSVTLCLALVRAGHTAEVIRKVIDAKVSEWGADPEMAKFLRPGTLLARKNFERYAADLAEATPMQRHSHGASRNISGADMLRELEAMERANVIDID